MNQVGTSVKQPFLFLNRHDWLITVIQIIFILILIVTLLIAIKPIRDYFGIIDDPAMVVFPVLAYIPHTLSVLALLEIIKRLTKQNFAEDQNIENFYSQFQFGPTESNWVMLIRKGSIGLVVLVTTISWIFGILTIPFGDSLLFSPLNMLTLSFVLSFLIVWFIYSIRIKNNPAAGYLILLAVINTAINTTAIIIVGDYLALPMTLSYQIFALLLILFRWMTVQIHQ